MRIQDIADPGADLSRQLDLLHQLSGRIARLTVTATDQTRTVKVTVNSNGAVTGLELSSDAGRYSPARLAEAILATMRKAQTALGAGAERVMTELPGIDAGVHDLVRSHFDDAFRTEA